MSNEYHTSQCDYCCGDDEQEVCFAMSGEACVCTRPKGHDGEHVGCSDDKHQLLSWDYD